MCCMFMENLITNIRLDFKHLNYIHDREVNTVKQWKERQHYKCLRVKVLLGFTWLSFLIQRASPFLWSWEVEFWTRLIVPSRASEDSNCSKTFTICQNSGLFSGCKDQHCSIKALREAGQLPGIMGLKFWKTKVVLIRRRGNWILYLFTDLLF